MEASRPLLASDDCEKARVVARSPNCLSRYLKAGDEYINTKKNTATDDFLSIVCDRNSADGLHQGNKLLCCRQFACWKWLFPDRVCEYEDFATSAQMGEIYALRQAARKEFDLTSSGKPLQIDDDMLQHLWDGLFSTLPYEGRVNQRWRDVGFQNDDPTSDLRTSGRLAIRMLLYFSDNLNDELKRMIRENRFPVCLCALNLLEMLLCHLKLKRPLPLVCPCCGTENAELETSQQLSRPHLELLGFTALMENASSLASSLFSNRFAYAEGGSAELALAHVFSHSMLVMDAVWKQQLQQDPSTNLMRFREALVETRKRIVAFLSRQCLPLTLTELDTWGSRQRARCHIFPTTPLR
ncbi:hypothetical protein CCR75_007090 [Bremia lactucae]|uniref:ELMO domain-containing protein n=1 Tax=Bremia lactucae TaxID=4779 RepID=A0A976FRL0_BRELC|nr:hypothetical protein CCR75_007090 [Bremia lactucae]